ncbi:MAG TPA: trehalose-phosphatase [Stellaceae bacterium]|nr:trehalose-phosphatase [Stellaceae bacterium]
MTRTDLISTSHRRLAALSRSSRDWALFLDVDGTLLDIAERPDRVQVPPRLVDDLQRIGASLGGALALVSGRAIAWIDHTFRPLRLPVAGQHGAEIRLTEDAPVIVDRAVNLDRARALLRPLERIDGIEIEDKGQAIAVHYRRARDQASAKAAIAEALAHLDDGIEPLPGRLVYDVKARGIDKGAAVARFAATPAFSGRMPVYFGDDSTDEYAFREVLARGGVAVQVGPAPAPPSCFWIEGPGETRRWLAGLFARAPASAGA